MSEEFVLIGTERNLKTYGLNSRPTFNELSQIPIVDYMHHAPVANMWFKHHFGKTPSQINIVYSAESVRAVLNAVHEDIGFGVLPLHLIKNQKGLKQIPTLKKPFENQIVLARQLGRIKTFREEEFICFYKDTSI
ncbi:MAG: LysR substrate-binding domain-containing protein [Bdellovibrionota bacterium]